MNPKNPNRLRILEVVKTRSDQGFPIMTYNELAQAVGLCFKSAMLYAVDWEDRGLLTRDQTGAFFTLTPANGDGALGPEAKSGIHKIPPLTQEQIEAARVKPPARTPKPAGWLRELIMGGALPVPNDAAPDDRELARQIIESESLAAKERRRARALAERRRNVAAAKRAFWQPSLPVIPKAEQLPMPKALAEPAKMLMEQVRAREAALEIQVEQFLKAKMERQAAREEQQQSSKRHCGRCMDMPWRRPKDALCKCGEAWGPDVVEISLRPMSPIALCSTK